jgi:hypothetical protein
MPKPPGGALPRASVEFHPTVWEQEVERYDPRSPARIQAQRARREIEGERAQLAWKRCEADGPRDKPAGMPQALRPAWKSRGV